jgi:RPA family protein
LSILLIGKIAVSRAFSLKRVTVVGTVRCRGMIASDNELSLLAVQL